MLKLDDSKWADYKDAYGPATGIPKLLQQLANNPGAQTKPSDEPWFSLWSSLCHQGDVYTASYAAVPHIVQIAQENNDNPTIDMNFFLLPASIEIARAKQRGPELPQEIESEYYVALKELGDCAARYLNSEDIYLKKAARAASLVAEDRISEAEHLLENE